MAKIITMTSGKGGVGKTTSSAAFGTALAMRGHKTCIIDFDVGLRNLDLIMGCERRVVFDFINVINGDARLRSVSERARLTWVPFAALIVMLIVFGVAYFRKRPNPGG